MPRHGVVVAAAALACAPAAALAAAPGDRYGHLLQRSQLSTPVVYAQARFDASAPHQVSVVTSASPLPPMASTIAVAAYQDAIEEVGWAILSLNTTNGTRAGAATPFTDEQQAFAAGFLEGALTQARIWQFIDNVWINLTYTGTPLGDYIAANFQYIQQQVAVNPGDAYWHQVALVFTQQDGLYEGYAAAAPPAEALSYLQLYSSTLQGDLDDLLSVFPESGVGNSSGAFNTGAHCSIIVKTLGDADAPTELMIAHTTWARYNTMTRIYKQYGLPYTMTGGFDDAIVPGASIAFSSYPGALFSSDDWYVTSARLAVSETTIANNNDDLWAYVQPTTVLEWARNMVANRLATDGPSWVATFSRENSGTYNNAWHVVDYNKFVPGQALADDTLWLLEQMPGPYIVAADHTDFLRNQGYWASYNRIESPFLFNLTGQWELVAKYGAHFTYNATARALIFDRNHSDVTDEASLQRLIRYNNFQNDPVATQGCKNGGRSGSDAISERGDLTSPTADCIDDVAFQNEGGIDAKYTTAALMARGTLASVVQSGPTYDQQPPFVWSSSRLAGSVPHAGQPDKWTFPWMLMEF